jgi:hypothetical protein
MSIFFVRRRGIARSAHELDTVFARLRRYEERSRTSPARWLHSFALRESDGGFGLACVFHAANVRVLRQHARTTQLGAEEIVPVTRLQIDHAFAPDGVWYVRHRDEPGDAAPDAGSLQRLRRYAVREADAAAGSRCLYRGADACDIADRLRAEGRPALEILPVLGRVVFRDDDELASHLATALADA